MNASYWLACTVGFPVLLAACNDPPTEPLPPAVKPVSTLPAEAVPGLELVDTPRVRVIDGDGRPLAGVEVYWTVQAGSGIITRLNTVTDSAGFSAVLWRLGPLEGANRLRAMVVAGDTVEFEVRGAFFRAERLVADGGIACGFQSEELWCWGPNFWNSGPPVSVGPEWHWVGSPGLLDDTHGFVEAAVASYRVCARDAAGAVWCYKEGSTGPVQVPGLPAVRQLVGSVSFASGLRQNFCALALSDSTAWCWQGDSVPSPIVGSPPFSRIWVAKADGIGTNVPYPDYRACGLLADSTAICWGRGPGGDGGGGAERGLATVSGSHRFVEMAVVDRASCGRTAEGDVWCWGLDLSGQSVPAPVQAGTAAALLSGYFDAFVTDRPTTGLGGWVRVLGTTLPPLTGVPTPGFASFAYNSSTCALASSDRVYCSNDLMNKNIFLTVPEIDYAPVQPVRQLPQTSVSR